MLKITRDSHTDHNLTAAHLELILARFGERDRFFAEVVDLPENVPALPSALRGPTHGDGPILEDQVYYERRQNREWVSRMVRRAPRMVRRMVVIAGPQGRPGGIILYTAYGGLIVSPREPLDPSVANDPAELERCRAFWSEHALNPE